jgi:protein SCO1
VRPFLPTLLGLLLCLAPLHVAMASLYTEPQGSPPVVPPEMLAKIGFDQHLNAQVPGSLSFIDEAGKPVRLGEFFAKGPVVLAMVYYGCPNLCTLVLNGLFKGLEDLTFTAGDTFQTVLVSIDPTETPKLAAEKKKNYLSKYHRAGAGTGIHFLTGTQPEIDKLAQTIGFRYLYDPKTKQYGHAAGLTVLTEQGRISRYLFGIEYAGRDMKLAIMDASQRKIGSLVDKFLLFCFHYDPAQGVYTVTIMKILRILAAATALGLGLAIYMMVRGERRRARRVLA